MKKIIISALLITFVLSACHKGKATDPVPQPNAKPATVSGHINPAAVPAADIFGSIVANGVTIAEVPDVNNNGDFKFSNLPPGTFTLHIVPPPQYEALKGKIIDLIAGANIDLGDLSPAYNPENGNLSGIISPANAIKGIIATSGSNDNYPATFNTVTGEFKIDNIPKGTYQLIYTTTDTYNNPSVQKVTIIPKQSLDAGTITFDRYGYSSELSFKSNIILAAAGRALTTYINNKLKLVSTGEALTFPKPDPSRIQTFTIYLENVTGPGTYVCSKNTENFISYSINTPYILNTSKQDNGNAVVTVTSIDPGTRTIKGSFSGTLAPVSSNTGTLNITDGVFTTTY